MPALTVVAPVYVLPPERTRVPAPDFVRPQDPALPPVPPEPLWSVIAPETVRTSAVAGEKLSEPPAPFPSRKMPLPKAEPPPAPAPPAPPVTEPPPIGPAPPTVQSAR